MITSNGKNEFINNEFSFWEWSAPVLQTHQEIISKIKELKLQGRVIKGFYTVGMGYNWNEEEIEDAIYYSLKRMIKENRILDKGPFPFLPQGVYISRSATVDEPFLIEFEDGDVLGIDYSESSCIRMEMNTVAKDIKFGTNRPSFHPNILFSSLIGKKIVAAEVTTSTEPDEFTCSHGLTIDEQDSYITKLALVCEDRDKTDHQRLEFSSWLDCGIIDVTDNYGEKLKIHAPDIKDVVEGFIDRDTLKRPDNYHFNK